MFYLNSIGLLCSLGSSVEEVRNVLLRRDRPVPDPQQLMQERFGSLVALVQADLAPLPTPWMRFDCRNNRLAVAALEQIRGPLDAALSRYEHARIGLVMATSTSGIAQSEQAVKALSDTGDYPAGYDAVQGTLGGLGEFCAAYLGLAGPVATLSTACSSSANAMLTARRWLRLGLCDAVVVGGVDSLCGMTVGGFGSLEALSSAYCRPFSGVRDGINIGEGAAVFLMTKEPGPVQLMGGAATSDAHHISAPHPEGEGAYAAMSQALADAQLPVEAIDYLNAHGTATPLNDAMESKAINKLFGTSIACSSSKSMTGHTLGAAGALELALCWLLLTQKEWRLPPSLYVTEQDEGIAPVRLSGSNEFSRRRPRYCMSNSFAFGGSNVALVIGNSEALSA